MSKFLQLPAEIRGRIYTFVLSHTLVDYVWSNPPDAVSSSQESRPEQNCVRHYLDGLPALQLVCKTVRTETFAYSSHWAMLYVGESTLRALQQQSLLQERQVKDTALDRQLEHFTYIRGDPGVTGLLGDFTMLRVPSWFLQGFIRRYGAHLKRKLLVLEVVLQRSPEQGLITPECVAMDFEFWMQPEVTMITLHPKGVIVFEYECVRDLQCHDVMKVRNGWRAIMQSDWKKVCSHLVDMGYVRISFVG